MKLFPVLKRNSTYGEVSYIPWALLAPYEEQAIKNHSQTLQNLADRGGLSPCEIVAIMEQRWWKPMDIKEAWQAIYNRITARAGNDNLWWHNDLQK